MAQHAVKATGNVCLSQCVCASKGVCLVWVSQTHLFPSRMDLMGATGQGADRFIRVIILGCPVSQSAMLQLPGLLGNHDGLQVDIKAASDIQALQSRCPALKFCRVLTESQSYHLYLC